MGVLCVTVLKFSMIFDRGALHFILHWVLPTMLLVLTVALFVVVRSCQFGRVKDKMWWGRDFPGGPVVKNPPSNAGDTGSIPGEGTKIPHAVGQLSLRALEPTHHN